MQDIINVLQEDIITLGLMIGSLAILEILNFSLGAIMAWAGGTFDAKTFFKGVLKAFLVAICMAIYCLILEILPMIFERANIIIPDDLMTYAQVLAIVVVAIKKYVKGVYEKLLTLLDVTEEEVEEIGYEPEDGQG